MTILIWAIVFIVSLAVLVKASDYFTDSAEVIGRFFGLPSFIVGVTIVAVGTSLPELISSVIAVLEGSSEIAVGNVIGSNITNIFLILGVTAIIGKTMKINHELMSVDLPLLVGATFLVSMMMVDGKIGMMEGFLCLIGLLVYFIYTIRSSNENTKEKKIEKKSNKKKLKKIHILILLVSIIFIYFGAKYTVESVVVLSGILGISKAVIAASAVALGTSLPELVVSVRAALKGKAEIAIGNVLGSNIFNLFGVLGVSAIVGVVDVSKDLLFFSLPMVVAATLLYLFITQDKKITKWEGWLLVIFYVFYIGKLFLVF